MHLLLNQKTLYPAGYNRVLGFRKSAGALLKEIRRRSSLPLIAKAADAPRLLTGDALAAFESDIQASLFYEEGDGFLLLLRQRAGYRLLNFYLHPGAKLCLPEQPSPLITELACREKDQDAMRRAQDALCALGFTEAFLFNIF